MPESEGPVLIAYDGSEHAKAAIEVAGRQLRTGRPAVVLAVWEPLEGLVYSGAPLMAMSANVDSELVEEAERVAREGVDLARRAGFEAEPVVERGAPAWRRIVEAADERNASVLVLGSHGRSGIEYAVMGSVATAVTHHTRRPVLIARAGV